MGVLRDSAESLGELPETAESRSSAKGDYLSNATTGTTTGTDSGAGSDPVPSRSGRAAESEPPRESNRANGKSPDSAESRSSATTGGPRRELSWRLEINRRKGSDNEYWYHWIYRLTLPNGERRSRYGGSLDKLPDPSRLVQYKRNSKKHARRNHEQKT